MNVRTRTVFLMVLWLAAGVFSARGDETDNTSPSSAAEAKKLSEGLIYSVDRTPESVFDTSRAVQVITHDQIVRANVQTLGQLLERQRSFAVNYTIGGSMPMVRGLAGKQVLFLIDGANVTNATWRGGSKEYLNIIDLNQVERIEIVRGVVSVLGTESLGAVVNIVTRKNGPSGDRFGGTVSSRFASADRSFDVPVTFYGSDGSLRYSGGLSYGKANDLRGGSGIGEQVGTSLDHSAAHFNGQWLLSQEKTIEFGAQSARVKEEGVRNPSLPYAAWDPAEMQFLRLSYQDLTSRRWEDSLKVTLFGNRQNDLRQVTLFNSNVLSKSRQHDIDTLGGANLELSRFFGAHHFVYGLDYTTERVNSSTLTTDAAGKVTPTRGNFMDGSSYQTLSAYVQDRFDIGRRLTLIAGARGGRFEKKGDENNSVGKFDIADKRANVTSALNAIVHVTPTLNLVGNVMKGYRVPNLDDVSHFLQRFGTVEVPNPNAIPEKVFSKEAGVKYAGSIISGSLMWYRNDFKNLLVRTNGTYNGLPYFDRNGNGKRDPSDPAILQNLNVGKATIDGVEADFTCVLRRGFSLYGNYSRLTGQDTANDRPLPAMPPAFGGMGLRFDAPSARVPWGELEYRFAEAQSRLNPIDLADPAIAANGVPAFHIVNVRAGMTVASRIGVSLGVENMFNKAYRFNGSLPYQPGRQLVLGTQMSF